MTYRSLVMALLLLSCERSLPSPSAPSEALPTPPPAAQLEANTPPTEADQPFKDVFRALDGLWVGQFKIYTDTRGQQEGKRPTTLDPTAFEKAPFALSLQIDVQQEYTSESPFFQRVKIKDTYSQNGQPKVVESSGVNKVQDGKLWCYVKKPDEVVIHSGTSPQKDVIIWQRDQKSPLKVEYFKESVTPDSYTIIGYGYYGNDDPQKTPRTYFYAQYKRPSPQ